MGGGERREGRNGEDGLCGIIDEEYQQERGIGGDIDGRSTYIQV